MGNMENNKESDRIDRYMLLLISLMYLFMYGKIIVGTAVHVSGLEWISFFIFAVFALFNCLVAVGFSLYLASEAIRYFGLPKNYVVATILSSVIAPLSILFLRLVLSGVIPTMFDPRVL